MYSCATKTESNPFFTEFQTQYGVPSFDKIKLEHYEPAFLKGIEEQNQNIEAIIESPEIPTFENTIVALDNSAPILDRVSAIFFNIRYVDNWTFFYTYITSDTFILINYWH